MYKCADLPQSATFAERSRAWSVAWSLLKSDERQTYEVLSNQRLPEAEGGLSERQRGRDVRHHVAVIENQVKHKCLKKTEMHEINRFAKISCMTVLHDAAFREYWYVLLY